MKTSVTLDPKTKTRTKNADLINAVSQKVFEKNREVYKGLAEYDSK
jgi:hypothetical protein